MKEETIPAKKIGFGVSLLNDIKITSVYIDNENHYIKIVYEKGLVVNVLNLTIEAAEEIGLINWQKLEKIIL